MDFSWSSVSIKTRIETSLIGCAFLIYEVEVVYPLKQGLKLKSKVFFSSYIKVEVVYPLKQGLKLSFEYFY